MHTCELYKIFFVGYNSYKINISYVQFVMYIVFTSFIIGLLRRLFKINFLKNHAKRTHLHKNSK